MAGKCLDIVTRAMNKKLYDLATFATGIWKPLLPLDEMIPPRTEGVALSKDGLVRLFPRSQA